MEKLVIATRESLLALWQANFIKAELEKIYPNLKVELLGMTTKGDQILDRALSKVGGKGLFIKELEYALLEKKADIAVHSMKDVPMQLENEFELAVTTKRHNAQDAFVSNEYEKLSDLPQGAVVGTSSLRREAQLRKNYPHLVIEPLRGNVQTRLRKLDEKMYDAIILASAGLERLGLGERIRSKLPLDEFIPAVGQAALGIEILKSREDLKEFLAPLNDSITEKLVRAEREFSRIFGGSCQIPIAAHAVLKDETNMSMKAMIAHPNGEECYIDIIEGPLNEPEKLAQELSQKMNPDKVRDLIKRVIELTQK